MTKKPPASGRAIFRSWVDAYRKKNPSAKIIEQRPVHQRRSSMRSTATKRMYAKIAARTMAEIAAIANMAVVDRFGPSGPGGGGARVGSMGSALDRLAALGTELHVARDLVAVRAAERLRRAALPAELEAGRDGLAALDARLAARGDGRVGPAVPAELRRHRVHRAALRARPLLGLLLGNHARDLRRHPVPEADPGPEADARAGATRRVRRGSFHRVRQGELLLRGCVRAAEHLGRGHLLEGFLDRFGQRDVQAADLDELDAERHEVRLRVRERALLDVVQAHREVDDLQAVRLHLAQRDVELLHDFVLDAVLDVRGCRGAERPDELVDERLRVFHAVPEVAEGAELDHVEVRVLEQECVLGAELAVDDPLLEVVDLCLLNDASEGLDEPPEDRRVLRRERIPVGPVEVREDLAVAVEHRDLVLADDDVVVHPDVSRDLPHDVLSLELVVPRHRHAARQALRSARRLVRAPSAAEEKRDGNHRVHRTWMPVTARVRVFHAVSKAAIASRDAFRAASRLLGSLASRTIGTTAAALSRDSSIA